MELEGQAEMQNAEANLIASQAVAQGFHDHVWAPTHEFLLRHKLLADTLGVALDVVGVAAAVVFVVCAAPELAAAAAAGSVVAGIGLATGTAASTGAIVLFGIDGTVYGAEMTGHEAFAKRIEDNPTIGWIRIGATIMLLPDLPVGGLRALKEIGTTTEEAAEALAHSQATRRLTGNARRDLGNVTNPSRHPAEVARQSERVRKFEAEAAAQTKLVDAANAKIRLLFARDIAVFPGGTVGGTALMVAAPPDVALSKRQQEEDEKIRGSLTPAAGMPKDVRMDIRVMGYSTPEKP